MSAFYSAFKRNRQTHEVLTDESVCQVCRRMLITVNIKNRGLKGESSYFMPTVPASICKCAPTSSQIFWIQSPEVHGTVTLGGFVDKEL
ncbi:hypothetical protein M413DRAFT_439237 [Hebeloma cylindrosporum]|uniref:Uncharacterized protein n=1 Tax=Hebeloma cylindrosporum TaxID=76867 RepID=A0A0C3CUK4_HEBCY|nr:hypothetical protein M413DRAFT_439237 [Hebeloma cylindrosporum h7]